MKFVYDYIYGYERIRCIDRTKPACDAQFRRVPAIALAYVVPRSKTHQGMLVYNYIYELIKVDVEAGNVICSLFTITFTVMRGLGA